MTIYELIFGTDYGQVCCCFHNDSRASAGIGPNGEYNCFACGAKAHDELGFIMKYFKVNKQRALKIQNCLSSLDKYSYTKLDLTDEQINYLKTIGITSDKVINEYFFRAATGNLMCRHLFQGSTVGYTWFNNPMLSNYNAGSDKYIYRSTIGGIVTPLNAVMNNTIIIAEGEKDMLTARSFGINNIVAKLGGAKTPLLCGEYFNNTNVIIIYDCDDAGREGAIIDANNLISKCNCNVKIVNLNLQDKEDLNDYFIKYKHTKQDLNNLIHNTPLYVMTQVDKTDYKLNNIVNNLTEEEINKLKEILNNKGEN